MNTTQATNQIRTWAEEMGFWAVGFSKAEFMDEEARRLEEWLNNGYHGKMSYMANHFDKRVDPSLLVPGAKTVISLAYNYYQPNLQKDPDAPKLSIYAYGKDYHKVIKDKLFSLVDRIQSDIAPVQGRCFVDSAPVLERDWAKRSGLGWIGKHTLLLSKKRGSYFFLAEMIIDLELDYDTSVEDHCGTCTRCIDACPTDAILGDGYLLDSSKCISYLTIELREEIPKEFKGQMDNWMFGCDICQQVCPWNRFSKPTDEKAFFPSEEVTDMTQNDWIEITESVFKRIFKDSPVERTGYKGLVRNIKFLEGSA